MRSRLVGLPGKALGFLRRSALSGMRRHRPSSAGVDYELLDERGAHVGTIRTAPSHPRFGRGAPTCLLQRFLRRPLDRTRD